ncbi:hypothetical protein ACLESO_27420 [Pyxidicoccus sp. 3LG]
MRNAHVAREEASLAPVAPSLSLAELREAMSSPGVIPSEVDALQAAIARPPADGASYRERADFLLSLMALPEEAAGRTGTHGRTVRAAAVEALMELGYPYALEVPPEVLEDVRREDVRRKGGSREAGASLSGIGFTVVAMLVQLLMVAMFSSGPRSLGSDGALETLSLVQLALVVFPPLGAIFGHLADSRRLQSLGATGMVLQGVVWFLYAVFQSMQSQNSGLWALLWVPWYLPALAAYRMRPRPEATDKAPTSLVDPS